uniref:Phospholipid scramblase n=1 Tax=Catagonus wagneri TaxID=51154 RepID=A0A8C3WUT9_9CETA
MLTAQDTSLPLSLLHLHLDVQCPPGVTIDFAAKHWNLCRAVYMYGPCSTYGCGSDSVFEVRLLDCMSNFGSIAGKWNGVFSAVSNVARFVIHFPLDLNVKMKAVISGACFLAVNFMYSKEPKYTYTNITHYKANDLYWKSIQ